MGLESRRHACQQAVLVEFLVGTQSKGLSRMTHQGAGHTPYFRPLFIGPS